MPKHYCETTGSQLLGRQLFVERQEVLFMVQLTRDVQYHTHLTALHTALEQNHISSFQLFIGSVLELCTPLLPNTMHDFPVTQVDMCKLRQMILDKNG